MDVWEMIRAERATLVDALAALSPADWDKPSLCAGWSIREVTGHLVALANTTPPKFLANMARARFNFNRMVEQDIQRQIAGRSGAELLEAYRSRIDARTKPPGPPLASLGETVVHAEDVQRAVGSYGKHQVEHLIAVADFYRGSNFLIGGKNRVNGVTLQATDADWRRGTGPEVSGPMVALLMALTGRKVALDDLHGEGVAVLRGRD